MLKDRIRKQECVVNFKQECEEKREPHTIIFISNDRVLSEKTIEAFAQTIICNDQCGECLNCKKLLSKNHPDVMYFPTKNQLLVDDSNKISAESFVKPIFADKKVFVIYNFDKSTEEAQNKLLKIFEEPNENVYYLLSTTCIEKVLPTIRSRCFKIYLNNLQREDLESEISAKCDRDLVLELAKNNLGKAIELSTNKNLEEVFELAFSILKDMKTSKQVVIYASKVLAKKDSFDLLLSILVTLLEDILAKLCKKDELVLLKSRDEALTSVVKDYTVKSVCEIEKLIRKVNEERTYNVNLTNVVDNLLLGILEVKYLCK